ncbi:MAG TPA: HAD-IA family hydrolase, partial [Candidatus Hodarchaeales archaeon]|nr:HAD-IA family hydrolase [Candidatus Hodarchaeales archaeon]
IKRALDYGYKVVIATNPLFSEIASDIRLQWAGLYRFKKQFSMVTTGNLIHHTKPHVEYYKEILAKLRVENPRECLMIGDDPVNDGAASLVGIEYFQLQKEEESGNPQPHFLDEQATRLFGKRDIRISYEGTLNDLYRAL